MHFKDGNKASGEKARGGGRCVTNHAHRPPISSLLALAGSVETDPGSLNRLCPLIPWLSPLPHAGALRSGVGTGGLPNSPECFIVETLSLGTTCNKMVNGFPSSCSFENPRAGSMLEEKREFSYS